MMRSCSSLRYIVTSIRALNVMDNAKHTLQADYALGKVLIDVCLNYESTVSERF